MDSESAQSTTDNVSCNTEGEPQEVSRIIHIFVQVLSTMYCLPQERHSQESQKKFLKKRFVFLSERGTPTALQEDSQAIRGDSLVPQSPQSSIGGCRVLQSPLCPPGGSVLYREDDIDQVSPWRTLEM